MASSSSMEVDGSSRGPFGGFQNRLGLEKSPYLLQHANNPVNWYSWGKEAFEAAEKEKKLIFLSTGYSACHWCHLMAAESFEDKEISQILNDNFVCIKVDREERPDVDQVYMIFVQATQGGCGWPLSVWLTPDRKPIVGGTYFPPEDRYFGRPGFKNILKQIVKAWQENNKAVLDQGDEVLTELGQAIKFKIEKGSELPDCSEVVKKCFDMMDKKYDSEYGGFGRAPKFPQPVYLEFMFRKYAADPETLDGKRARDIGLDSLRKMVLGGIYDHIGKGFHRYSTDAEWHLPYFEKMLYDQAQLAVAYASAFQISKEPVFADILREILSYVTSCLSHKDGGFYCAEDSDSFPTESATEKREGAFYVWTHDELLKSLDTPVPGKEGVTDGNVFEFHYSAAKLGNIEPFKDPHAELAHQNVLIIRGDLNKTAEKFDLPVEDIRKILETARQKLSVLRQKRPRPLQDNKILTSWNGLMISGFAHAAQVLDDPEYLTIALRAIKFLHETVFQPQHERLLRCYYFDSSSQEMVIGPNPIPGFADDYAMLINGLLDTYEVCFDEKLLLFAKQLQHFQNTLFWDVNDYGYFMTATGNESELILRLKDGEDGDQPSANSISCRNLLRLAKYLDLPEFEDRAVKLMSSFSNRMQNMPIAVSEMIGALMFHSKSKQIIICGNLDSADTKALIHCINSHYLPNKMVIVTNKETEVLRDRIKGLSSMQSIDGKATAYVCENFEWKQPAVNTVDELEKLLI